MFRRSRQGWMRPLAAAALAAALLTPVVAAPAAAAAPGDGEPAATAFLHRFWDALSAVFAGAGGSMDPDGSDGEAGSGMDPDGFTLVPQGEAGGDMDPNGLTASSDDGEAGSDMDPDG